MTAEPTRLRRSPRMEDIVAVEVTLDTAEKRYFLTWGRVHHRVDPAPLEALLLRVGRAFDLGGAPVSARLCATLQEAAGQPYFYECSANRTRPPRNPSAGAFGFWG